MPMLKCRIGAKILVCSKCIKFPLLTILMAIYMIDLAITESNMIGFREWLPLMIKMMRKSHLELRLHQDSEFEFNASSLIIFICLKTQ